MNPYKKVSCDLYDQYEIYATFKKQLEIEYINENGDKKTVNIQIKTLETKNKEEFLITTDGIKLRLDKIVSIREIS